MLTEGSIRKLFLDVVPLVLSLFYADLPPFGTNLVYSISATALVAIYITVFNGIVWPLLSRATPRVIPNFSGRWVGYITERRHFEKINEADSYVEKIDRMVPVFMQVNQDFFRIAILFRSETDTDLAKGLDSGCTMAAVDFADIGNPRLRHTFARADMVGEVRLALTDAGGRPIVLGNYSSSKQRVGHLEMARIRRKTTALCGEVMLLSGVEGPYVGIRVDPLACKKYTTLFRRCVGRKRFRHMNSRRDARDGQGYHMTVIGPDEMPTLSTDQRAWMNERFLGKMVWVELEGVGKQERDGKSAFFIIARSSLAQDTRKALGLKFKHFHVTLGFDVDDLNDVEKGDDTRISVLREKLVRAIGR